MRKQQLTLNRMRKYQILVNKGKANITEGTTLYSKLENTGLEAIKELEVKVDSIICHIKAERTQRWRSWVEHSWDHQNNIHLQLDQRKERKLSLIVAKGGSAQMKDILKLAEETWGGLWVVETDDLPTFDQQHMPLITEDEVRRVVNNLAD
eukprot:16439955-Heterocapsa_arctica.AAC.1